ncbi:MAG: formylglycine-generating enzyme family protein [Cyanobacteria bacterium J06659_2]
MLKRRKFFQYAGLGSVGFLLTTRDGIAPSMENPALIQPDRQTLSDLKTFEFSVTTVDQAGQVKRRQTHTAKLFPEPLKGAEKLEMVAIASGQFWMGASQNQSRSQGPTEGYDLPRHRVNLPSFFISKYPITQAQWAAVAALPQVQRPLDAAPSHFQGRDRPVESISWLEAVEFCDRLSQHTGRRYQLPSEAQWEYACRAETQTPFNVGETVTSQLANYVGTYTYKAESVGDYRQATVPVGSFSPNAFGLQDMHGNVWEWCADSWHHNYRGAPTDGKAWVSAQRFPMRAIRGGSWLDAPVKTQSASRSGYFETALNRTIGFRVSMASL